MSASRRQSFACLFITLVALAPAVGAAAESRRVFFTDFNSGAPPEVGGITTLAPVQAYQGVGYAGNRFAGMLVHNTTGGADSPTGRVPGTPTRVTLTDLPGHTSVDLNFLLAIINTWDDFGNGRRDLLTVRVDGTEVFSESFSFTSAGDQSYQAPPGVLLTPRSPGGGFADRGFNNSHGDAAYDMGLEPAFNNIAHVGPTLTVEIFGGGTDWSGGSDESWGMDNFEVVLNGVVPEPSSLTLLAMPALLALTRRRRRRQPVP